MGEGHDTGDAIGAFRESGRDAPAGLVLASDEWRPFVAFVEGWHTPPLDEGGFADVGPVDAIEERIGRRLPACLREWYRMVADHPLFSDAETTPDGPIPPEYVRLESGLLRFYAECQEGWYGGIREGDLGRPNPPVYLEVGSFDLVGDAGVDPARLVDGRLLVADELTEFLHRMLLRQTGVRWEAGPSLRPGVCGADFANLDGRGDWDPAPIRAHFGLPPAAEFPPGFCPSGGADLVVIENGGIVARTAGHLDEAGAVAARHGGLLVNRWEAPRPG